MVCCIIDRYSCREGAHEISSDVVYKIHFVAGKFCFRMSATFWRPTANCRQSEKRYGFLEVAEFQTFMTKYSYLGTLI